MEVAGTIASTSGGFRLPDGTVLDDAGDLGEGSGYWSSTTGGIHYSSGNVGIGTTSPNYRLQVGETSNYGYVDASGAWQSSSDTRQKENISEIDSGLDKILAMRSVEYNTIGDDPVKERQIGFLAQEMEVVIPEIVSTDTNGYKGVAYAKLTPVLVKAMQEQQELLLKQQEMIEDLQKQIAEFKNN